MRPPWFVWFLNVAVIVAGAIMMATAHNVVGTVAAAIVIAGGGCQLFLTPRAARNEHRSPG